MSTQTSTQLSMRIIKILVIILLILIVVYLGIGAYSVSQVTQIGDHDLYFDTPASFGVEYQEVNFPSRIDELDIAAWFIPNASSDKVIIIVHGRDASKQWAESGTIVAFQADLFNAGYAVLAIDLRGHGESENARYSFGVYERRDILGAVDWLKNQGFKPGKIGVMGISLGGAAVIGAMAESEDIGAVVTEGTFAAFYPIILEQWETESGLPNFFLPGAFLMNRIMYGYSLAAVNSADEIKKSEPRPMLIIHCSEDETIDLTHPAALMEAAVHVESWIQDECEHAELYRDYPEEYSLRVIEFFDKNP
ncbi:MAG: alpha/beta fold hydrolase [Chloroflexi bacterium]|nr:alpha/beta fold hydrolase [Chloroflexota bacterium]